MPIPSSRRSARQLVPSLDYHCYHYRSLLRLEVPPISLLQFDLLLVSTLQLGCLFHHFQPLEHSAVDRLDQDSPHFHHLIHEVDLQFKLAALVEAQPHLLQPLPHEQALPQSTRFTHRC